MSKMIQIRNVSDEVHAELRSRAARAGMSLSDYLKRELERIVSTKPMFQIFEELAKDRVTLEDGTAAAAIREGRP